MWCGVEMIAWRRGNALNAVMHDERETGDEGDGVVEHQVVG